MKKRFKIGLALLIATLMLLTTGVALAEAGVPFAGGAGAAEDPRQIENI